MQTLGIPLVQVYSLKKSEIFQRAIGVNAVGEKYYDS